MIDDIRYGTAAISCLSVGRHRLMDADGDGSRAGRHLALAAAAG